MKKKLNYKVSLSFTISSTDNTQDILEHETLKEGFDEAVFMFEEAMDDEIKGCITFELEELCERYKLKFKLIK